VRVETYLDPHSWGYEKCLRGDLLANHTPPIASVKDRGSDQAETTGAGVRDPASAYLSAQARRRRETIPQICAQGRLEHIAGRMSSKTISFDGVASGLSKPRFELSGDSDPRRPHLRSV
jgi:hypothetical protein